eukprot:3034024-Prymnesium_polylepis.1
MPLREVLLSLYRHIHRPGLKRSTWAQPSQLRASRRGQSLRVQEDHWTCLRFRAAPHLPAAGGCTSWGRVEEVAPAEAREVGWTEEVRKAVTMEVVQREAGQRAVSREVAEREAVTKAADEEGVMPVAPMAVKEVADQTEVEAGAVGSEVAERVVQMVVATTEAGALLAAAMVVKAAADETE